MADENACVTNSGLLLPRGTLVGDRKDDEDVGWGRTEDVCKRLSGSSEFERPANLPVIVTPYDEASHEVSPYGYFAERPIIGRDTVNIIGGVYLGGSSREAIVVDDRREQPGDKYLREFYESRFLRVMNYMCRFNITERKFLRLAYEVVLEAMPYNEWKVDGIINHYNVHDDRKIHLAVFLHERAGVCRHLAVLVAYLIARYSMNPNRLFVPRGRVRVMRNQVKRLFGGAHAWAQYDSTRTWIMDPAQKMFGTIKDVQRKGCWWDYSYPE